MSTAGCTLYRGKGNSGRNGNKSVVGSILTNHPRFTQEVPVSRSIKIQNMSEVPAEYVIVDVGSRSPTLASLPPRLLAPGEAMEVMVHDGDERIVKIRAARHVS